VRACRAGPSFVHTVLLHLRPQEATEQDGITRLAVWDRSKAWPFAASLVYLLALSWLDIKATIITSGSVTRVHFALAYLVIPDCSYNPLLTEAHLLMGMALNLSS
jgi:hypothetical protein